MCPNTRWLRSAKAPSAMSAPKAKPAHEAKPARDVEAKPVRTFTKHYPSFVEEKEATALYDFLLANTKWEEGIKGKDGFTRLQYGLKIEEAMDMENPVMALLHRFCEMTKTDWGVMGVYLNYYKDGEMYTPMHSHKNTVQLIISLGATRTLKVGKNNYITKNGDAVIFGSSLHGVAKEPEVKEGRISIAFFLRRIHKKLAMAILKERGVEVEKDDVVLVF